MPSLRLVFMGTPEFAVPTLEALLEAGHEVVAAYARAPRPAGRGKAERPSPVHERAEQAGIPVHTPRTLRDAIVQQAFAAHRADAAVVVAYGLILPAPVLQVPRLGCLNLHASLLPRWRGAAPIQRAVMACDEETGVSAMLMDEGLDTGPVLLQERVPITHTTTAGRLHDRLARLGAPLMVRGLEALAAGTLTPQPQPEEGATHAAKVDKAEARIDWTLPARELACRIRGLSPFPGAWFRFAGMRIKAHLATATDGRGRPGEVLSETPLVVGCREGAVALAVLQREGRGPLDAHAFLRGCPIRRGTMLD